MNLRERLIAGIAERGPMSVADYMTACLHDPCGGYYATRPRLGARGDFITAPHVSQMFGELIGLWAAEVWDQLGRPARAVRIARPPLPPSARPRWGCSHARSAGPSPRCGAGKNRKVPAAAVRPCIRGQA